MRFTQLDRILEVTAGESLRACRCLALSEHYLDDHFPRFPVMPGVLMMEALFQASMWLVRVTDDFQHSMVVLESTRNLKFQGFVQPGDRLDVLSEIKNRDGDNYEVRVSGTIKGQLAVNGRMVLTTFNTIDRGAVDEMTDVYMRREFRRQFRRMLDPFNPAVPLAVES